LTQSTPKALIEVAGEPFIAHQLRLLARNGIQRVVVCAGFLGEMVRDRVGDGAQFGLQVEFSFDGPRLMGTAGALRKARPMLGPAFFVVYGDSYLRCDYRAIQHAFEAGGRLGLMTVFRNDGRWDRSNVQFIEGAIQAYDKSGSTPDMHHIDYGLGVLDSRALDLVPEDRPADLAQLYQDLLARGELTGYEVRERFYEIGSTAGLEETRRLLASIHLAEAVP
jgi:NDP-sugar pyrophosphorylase family protein